MSSELQQQVHHSQPAHMHMGKGLPSQGLGLGGHLPEHPPQQKAPGPSRAEAQQQPQHKVGQLCCSAVLTSCCCRSRWHALVSGRATAVSLAALSLYGGSIVGLPLA